MTENAEMDAILTYQLLVEKGYEIFRRAGASTWIIAEPKDRDRPQQGSGYRTIGECYAWAKAVENARMVKPAAHAN